MSDTDIPFRCGYAGLFGPPNAGKSTLVNALLGAKVSIVTPRAHTTRNRILGIKTTAQMQLVLVDTPGFVSRNARTRLHRFLKSEAGSALQDADVHILVIDVSETRDRSDSYRRCIDEAVAEGLTEPDIIALNKIDLVTHEQLLPAIQALAEVLSERGFSKAAVVPVSAKSKSNLDALEREIFARIPEGPKLYDDADVTTSGDRFFVAELIREQLFLQLREELPYGLAVTVDRWEESDRLLRVYATILVGKQSHKPMVIGQGGALLKQVGRRVRLELEELWELKVHLELFVRVEEGWVDSPQLLREAGYETDSKER